MTLCACSTTPVKCPDPLIETRSVNIDSLYLVKCEPMPMLTGDTPDDLLNINAIDSDTYYDCMLRHNELVNILISQ